MTKPLQDIRVCDVSQNLAGPFCSQILGDLGAEVIKIEPPSGDPARPWGPPFWGEDSTLFLCANRNKRSILLDLKTDAGRDVLHRIAAESDVFLQSSRIGVPARLGFDYASIREQREDIVYMAITAFGDRGPMKDFPGYDPLIQAFAGIMSVTGHPGGEPARVGGSVVDFGTGMWAAIAILAALRERDRTGEGADLSSALLDTAVGWISYHIMGYLSTGVVPGPMGSGLGSIAPYQAFPTSDGSVMIAAGNDGIFRRLCTALEIDELADDPRFATNPERVENRDVLIRTLSEETRRRSTDALVEAMRRHSVPCSPIQDIAEVVEDPQVTAAELIPAAEHPDVPGYRDVAIPFRMNGTRPRGEIGVPRPGEHASEILESVGFGPAEVERLRSDGVVSGLAPVSEAGD